MHLKFDWQIRKKKIYLVNGFLVVAKSHRNWCYFKKTIDYSCLFLITLNRPWLYSYRNVGLK